MEEEEETLRMSFLKVIGEENCYYSLVPTYYNF